MPSDLLPLIDQIETLLATIQPEIGIDVKLIQISLWLSDLRSRVVGMAVEASDAG